MTIKDEIIQAAPSQVDRLMEETMFRVKQSGQGAVFTQASSQVVELKRMFTKMVKRQVEMHGDSVELRILDVSVHGNVINVNLNITVDAVLDTHIKTYVL